MREPRSANHPRRPSKPRSPLCGSIVDEHTLSHISKNGTLALFCLGADCHVRKAERSTQLIPVDCHDIGDGLRPDKAGTRAQAIIYILADTHQSTSKQKQCWQIHAGDHRDQWTLGTNPDACTPFRSSLSPTPYISRFEFYSTGAIYHPRSAL